MVTRALAVLLSLLLLFAAARALSAPQWAEGTSVEGEVVRDISDIAQINKQGVAVSFSGSGKRIPSRFIEIAAVPTARGIPEASLWQKITRSGGQDYSAVWKAPAEKMRSTWRAVRDERRAARDARWTWQGRWRVVPHRNGSEPQGELLWQLLQAKVRKGGGEVSVPRRQVLAKRTRGDLLRELPTQLLVDQSDFKLYVFRRGKLEKTYPVAVGMPGWDTPNGNWTVIERAVDPAWLPPDWAGEQAGILVPGGSPDNPLVSRWMGIGDGVGIHGTSDVASLGSRASHGCVRMDPGDVEELYEIVPMGTPLRIQS